ncbi:hypothetical protein GLA29479_1988 [Lysobacter antibioticus]|nr:hypothetical protein GLA29479_1988 [Lysobacter antibioticus]
MGGAMLRIGHCRSGVSRDRAVSFSRRITQARSRSNDKSFRH